MQKILLTTIISIFVAGSAYGQVQDKKYKNWTVYTVKMQGKKTCFIASFAKSKSGNYKRRDEPYFMVTYLGRNVAEVSTSSGYKYAKGSKVNATVGNRKFTMFTAGELAWADDRKADKAFIDEMKKRNFMRIRGTSIKGTYSLDKYSLAGFTAAYNRMKKKCG